MSAPRHHTPESVLSLLSSLLPLLSQPPPLSPVTQAQLASLCVGLKQTGGLLEGRHCQSLDFLQQQLTALCQDTGVDIVLRLQMLEVIELRSLGWKSSPIVESYYRERFQKYGAPMEIPASLPSPVQGMVEDSLLVGGTRVFLQSQHPGAVREARQVLEEFFSRQQEPPPQVQYSRAALLSLGSSLQALLPPTGWHKLAPSLPSAVLPKAPGMEKGDIGPSQGRDGPACQPPMCLPLLKHH